MKFRLALAIALLIALGSAAEPIPPEVILLAQVKAKAKHALASVPAYACTESMERFTRTSSRYTSRKVDELKLEVAEIGGKELFAKAGSKTFDERSLEQIVTTGLIGTGMFYHMAKNLMEGSAPAFRYAGRKKITGHSAVQYDFEVSPIFAGYRLNFNNHEAQCGMKGSMWADEKSQDLIRVRIAATQIPLALRMQQAVTEIDYGRAALGGESFLIPTACEIITISLTGQEERNQIRFSNCHKYGVESTLSFQ